MNSLVPRRLPFAIRVALTTVFLAVGIVSHAAPVLAHDYQLGGLAIGHPWGRATPPSARVGAGFLTVNNSTAMADRLLGVSSPAARQVEIHETRRDGELMRMVPHPQGLVIAPGQTLTLAPGAFHLMFVELAQPLRAGERVSATLTFERAGSITVELVIAPLRGPDGQHSGH